MQSLEVYPCSKTFVPSSVARIGLETKRETILTRLNEFTTIQEARRSKIAEIETWRLACWGKMMNEVS